MDPRNKLQVSHNAIFAASMPALFGGRRKGKRPVISRGTELLPVEPSVTPERKLVYMHAAARRRALALQARAV